MKKKSKKTIKLEEGHQRGQHRNTDSLLITPFMAVSTPKNHYAETGSKLLKSPEAGGITKKRRKSNAKMVSMPASPAKSREKGPTITPDVSRKRLFKKK